MTRSRAQDGSSESLSTLSVDLGRAGAEASWAACISVHPPDGGRGGILILLREKDS